MALHIHDNLNQLNWACSTARLPVRHCIAILPGSSTILLLIALGAPCYLSPSERRATCKWDPHLSPFHSPPPGTPLTPLLVSSFCEERPCMFRDSFEPLLEFIQLQLLVFAAIRGVLRLSLGRDKMLILFHTQNSVAIQERSRSRNRQATAHIGQRMRRPGKHSNEC